MNMLDKYIAEVGKHLPHKNRQDLQKEIRSTIQDMLDDRSQQSGKPIDEALISQVLQEYGAPAKVAAAYQPTRYLIGPRLYPFFEMVVKIVLSVLAVVGLIRFGISFADGGATGAAFFAALGKYGLEWLAGMISAFGNIVLVFAILERVLPASEFEEEAEKWSPAELDALPDPDKVARAELIFESIFILLGLALFNLYPDLIGFMMVKDSTWVYVPALSEAFFRYLPWINLLGLLQIVLNLYLLRRGYRQTLTDLFSLATEAAGVVLAFVMLTGPSLISVEQDKLAEILGEPSGVVLGLFSVVPLIVLGILVVVQSIEVIQIIRRLLRRRSQI